MSFGKGSVRDLEKVCEQYKDSEQSIAKNHNNEEAPSHKMMLNNGEQAYQASYVINEWAEGL